jgi:kinetochore protein Mis13/DSN1
VTVSLRTLAKNKIKTNRCLDYDEEDDGFMFTRAKSKRTKATTTPREDPIREDVHQDIKLTNQKRSRKKSTELSVSNNEEAIVVRKRSTRNSGDGNAIEPSEVQIQKKRSKRISVEPQQATSHNERPAHKDSSRARARTPENNYISTESTKIALPFADTPVIRRNKEMRKASNESRRSSLSMRGRRASSLIDSGTSNGLYTFFLPRCVTDFEPSLTS